MITAIYARKSQSGHIDVTSRGGIRTTGSTEGALMAIRQTIINGTQKVWLARVAYRGRSQANGPRGGR